MEIGYWVAGGSRSKALLGAPYLNGGRASVLQREVRIVQPEAANHF